jgi:hypothetical protein
MLSDPHGSVIGVDGDWYDIVLDGREGVYSKHPARDLARGAPLRKNFRRRRTSLRHNMRPSVASRVDLRRTGDVDINTWMHIFAGILTQYDQKEMARETKRGGHGNIYRLGHYLKALRQIGDSVQGLSGRDVAMEIRAAIEVNFTSGNPGDKLRKVVDAYLEHGTLPKYPVQKLAKNGLLDACTYCKASPGGKHKWWCKKLAKNSRKRTSRHR